jgi:hypothetical protein
MFVEAVALSLPFLEKDPQGSMFRTGSKTFGEEHVKEYKEVNVNCSQAHVWPFQS